MLPMRHHGAHRDYAPMLLVIAAFLGIAQPVIAASLSVFGASTFVLPTGERIRLFDIVTPATSGCSCVRECVLGREAEDFLQRMISRDGTTIRIERYGIDPDGTIRAKVFVDLRDLATLLIDRGFARLATSNRGAGWCTGFK